MPDPSRKLPPDAPEIPGYELRELLGKGGQGAVYRARQKSLNRVVAIKVLDAKHAEDRAARKRFLAEARLQSKLHHPNILQGIDINSHEGVWFFAMEFVSGTNAHELLTQRGQPMSEGEALEIARQVTAALSHAYERSIVHGDIKPENIVLGADGAVKMIDFGIARLAREERRKGTPMGTAEFMAPEVADGTSVGDIRSDFFSLGVTLYEMLTASLPPLAQCTNDRGPDPKDREPGVSKQTGTLVSKLLANDPAQRPENPRALLIELEAAIDGSPARPLVSPSRRAPANARKLGVRVAAGLVLAAVAIGLFMASGIGDSDSNRGVSDPSSSQSEGDPNEKTPPPTRRPDGPTPPDSDPDSGTAGSSGTSEPSKPPPERPDKDTPKAPESTPDRTGTTQKPNLGAPEMTFSPGSIDVFEGEAFEFAVSAKNLPAAFDPTLKVLDAQGRDISATVEMPEVSARRGTPSTIDIKWTAPFAPRHEYRKIAIVVSQPPLQKRFWIGIDDRNRPPTAKVDGDILLREGADARVIPLSGHDPDGDVIEYELLAAGGGVEASVDENNLIIKVPDLPGSQGGKPIPIRIKVLDDLDGESIITVRVRIEDVDHAPTLTWDLGKSPFVVITPRKDGGPTILRGAARGGLNALLRIRDPDTPDLVYNLTIPRDERPKGLSIKAAENGQTRLTWRSTSKEPWGPRAFTVVASAQGAPERTLPFRLQVVRRIEPAPASSHDPIDRALDWLARHQLDDGSFPMSGRDFARFSDDENDWGSGREEHRVGVAAIAIIAALRAGDASPWVSKAVRYLVSVQNDEGRVALTGRSWTYSHALATEALVLAWHLLGDPEFRKPAVKALRHVEAARQPDQVGGWRYAMRPEESDTSVSVWALRALLAGRMAGFDVNDAHLRGGLAYIESMLGDTGRVGYQEPDGAPTRGNSVKARFLPKLSESLTAAGLSVLASSSTLSASDPRVRAGIRRILACPPAWSFRSRAGLTLTEKLTYEEKRKRASYETQDFYYWQHATAFFRSWRIARGKGVSKSNDWKSFLSFAKSQQRKSGDARGSWDPTDPWSNEGGRSYATAMIALAAANLAFDAPLTDE